MRFLIYPATAAALAIGFMSPSAQAAQSAHLGKLGPGTGSGGWATGPNWQGLPTDRLLIWRYGHLQGNDPDQNIRLQLMRDPTNDAHR
jgi:hypothetical protein